MMGFSGLSLFATAVLITGQWGSAGLYAGRMLTGVVSGAVFAVGTAWVKELSDDAPPGAGARRAALALTGGFAAGPLVAGLLAQWLPAPQLLPYLVHLVLAVLALALLVRAPETLHPSSAGRPPLRILVPTAASRRFTRVVLPLAPWVFGSVTLVFTTLPAQAAGPVGGATVAFPGVLAALALGAGIVSQRLGRRLLAAPGARASATTAAGGLAWVSAGCLAASLPPPRPLPPA